MRDSNNQHRTDPPWRERGIGMSALGRLCSRCHQPASSTGGGVIGQRWYGPCCKPIVLAKREAARQKAGA